MTTVSTRRSLFAATGAVVMGSGITAGFAASVADLVPTDPDAELIALCDEHIKNHRAFNLDGGHLENERDPLWASYERTYAPIDDAKPVTMAGVLAKARAAQNEAVNPNNGGFDWDEGTYLKWSSDVVDDLLRIAGEG